MKFLLPLLPFLTLAFPAPAQDLYDESTLREIHLTFSQANWWNQLEANYGTGVEIPADLMMAGVTYSDVGVRFKGNTSFTRPNTQKKSFNISMNSFVDGQDLLGYSTLNLNNAFMDPTFMREVLFSKACRSFTTAAKGNFIHLIINGENWGVYANIQQLNKDFLEEWYPTDTGDRFKIPSAMHNPGKASFNWLGSNSSNYEPWYELKTEDLTAYDRIRDLCRLIDNSPTGSTYVSDIEEVMNLDRALWTLALENCFMDSDGYVHKGSDYALYRDNVQGRWNLLQRDANEAFGSFSRNSWGTNGTVNLHPDYDHGNVDLPLMRHLMNFPEMHERYLAHFRCIMEEWLDPARTDPLIDAWDVLIRAEVQADNKKIYSFSDYTTNLDTDVNNGNTVFKGLRQFVDERRNYLSALPEFNRPLPNLSGIRHVPAAPAAGEIVKVTVSASAPSGSQLAFVNLHLRQFGAYQITPMFDDGAHGDGQANDAVWGALIPGLAAGSRVEYYVSAGCDSASGGAWEFLPRTAEFQAPSWNTQAANSTSPCINEFMAINGDTVSDEMGEFDDWVEILNRDSTPLDLSGFFLSDNSADLVKWIFPVGTQVGVGESVLVWADNEESQGPLHAGFKLSGSGETLFLTSPDGTTVLDAFSFGVQRENFSSGRLLDGQSQWVTFSGPTPGTSNQVICGYRSFDQLDASAHPLELLGVGLPAIGGSVQIEVRNAPSSSTILLFASRGSDEIADLTSAGTVLLDMSRVVFQQSVQVDSAGVATFIAPLNNPALVGQAFYAQAISLNMGSDGALSNGLELVVCP